MLRQLLFSRSKGIDLHDSTLFTEVSFYSTFHRDLKHAKHEVVIESPHFAILEPDMTQIKNETLSEWRK